MRLIDADYLNNKLIHNCRIKKGGIPLKFFHAHKKILELYPTVEAEPVRHGHWELWDADMNAYECNCCKGVFILEEGNPKDNCYKYCPHCGTKMDEGE